MEQLKRKYNGKDVDMLIAISTIIESAITNKAFLQSQRTTWADPFFDDLKTEIDNIVRNHLGIDNAKELRESTIVLTNLQKQAIIDLAKVKVQINEDFKANKTRQQEILNQLGFNAYHKEAQKGDQEALIQLLYKFKTNLNAALKNEISEKGTPTPLLERITAFADELKKANITQENFKGERKTITTASINEFNAIYDKVISISKIASNFYKGQAALQSQFSYNKIVKSLSSGTKSKGETSTK